MIINIDFLSNIFFLNKNFMLLVSVWKYYSENTVTEQKLTCIDSHW